jgi:hypothetical protein
MDQPIHAQPVYHAAERGEVVGVGVNVGNTLSMQVKNVAQGGVGELAFAAASIGYGRGYATHPLHASYC